jgi:hypothetical protein
MREMNQATQLFQCPYCPAVVLCQPDQSFRCPSCGFNGENQLSLLNTHGVIKPLGTFDPVRNALCAHLYHQEKEEKNIVPNGGGTSRRRS